MTDRTDEVCTRLPALVTALASVVSALEAGLSAPVVEEYEAVVGRYVLLRSALDTAAAELGPLEAALREDAIARQAASIFLRAPALDVVTQWAAAVAFGRDWCAAAEGARGDAAEA